MHDNLWVLIYVGALLIGVISSIMKRVRRSRTFEPPQMQRAAVQRTFRPAVMPPSLIAQQAAVPAAARITEMVAPELPAPQAYGALSADEPEARRPRWNVLFENRNSIVRAVIASEVLGRPLGLRD